MSAVASGPIVPRIDDQDDDSDFNDTGDLKQDLETIQAMIDFEDQKRNFAMAKREMLKAKMKVIQQKSINSSKPPSETGTSDIGSWSAVGKDRNQKKSDPTEEASSKDELSKDLSLIIDQDAHEEAQASAEKAQAPKAEDIKPAKPGRKPREGKDEVMAKESAGGTKRGENARSPNDSLNTGEP